MAYIQRGVGDRGFVLVNDGYRYHRHRIQKNNIIWRCWRRSTCDARLKSNQFQIDGTNQRIRVITVCVRRTVILYGQNALQLVYVYVQFKKFCRTVSRSTAIGDKTEI
jgi:hypothetical protein